jgi:hypothetical protein
MHCYKCAKDFDIRLLRALRKREKTVGIGKRNGSTNSINNINVNINNDVSNNCGQFNVLSDDHIALHYHKSKQSLKGSDPDVIRRHQIIEENVIFKKDSQAFQDFEEHKRRQLIIAEYSMEPHSHSLSQSDSLVSQANESLMGIGGTMPTRSKLPYEVSLVDVPSKALNILQSKGNDDFSQMKRSLSSPAGSENEGGGIDPALPPSQPRSPLKSDTFTDIYRESAIEAESVVYSPKSMKQGPISSYLKPTSTSRTKRLSYIWSSTPLEKNKVMVMINMECLPYIA